MREKIFKGKRKDNGEWVEGYHIVGCEVADYIIPHHSLENGKPYGGYEAWDKTFYVPEFFEVFPETVRESTGLTDMNKTPIFEGDLLKDENGVIWLMEYAVGWWSYQIVSQNTKTKEHCCIHPWTDKDNKNYLPKITIIGNKWDNPELLED